MVWGTEQCGRIGEIERDRQRERERDRESDRERDRARETIVDMLAVTVVMSGLTELKHPTSKAI